ncbi:MAG TPA: hypothetical protein VM899_16850 [Rubellimicrobium sp.]|nr:hypothetical protein [Rubellimicrobium sp.]
MSTTVRLPRLGLLEAFGSLLAYHPASTVFAALQTKNAGWSAEEALALMPPHLRDDLGLPPILSQKPEHPALTKARSRGRNWG